MHIHNIQHRKNTPGTSNGFHMKNEFIEGTKHCCNKLQLGFTKYPVSNSVFIRNYKPLSHNYIVVISKKTIHQRDIIMRPKNFECKNANEKDVTVIIFRTLTLLCNSTSKQN